MKKIDSYDLPGWADLGKVLRIMKLTTFLILCCIVQTFASPVFSQETQLNLDVRNSTIEDVLSQIERQSNYVFFYNKDIVDVQRSTNIRVENASIRDVLNQLFTGTNIKYHIVDRQIVLSPEFSNQQKPVSGKVTDKDGGPLPGVTVVIKGTTNGTVTDADGKFNMAGVPAGSTLEFSFVGMKTQEITVDSNTFLNVIMAPESIGVDEVVVTALGIKRAEKALGYAVQKVVGDQLSTVKGVDVATSLTGKVSGLMVKNSTEFAVAPTITIRGETPLLVVDGVPYGNLTLNDVPADDIQSISVLKGATASALYGYRGGSGAIMITTKQGLNKMGVSVTVNSSTMFNAGFLAIPKQQTVYGRGTGGVYKSNGGGEWGAAMDGTPREQWDPISKSYKTYPYLPIGKDNFKNFLEPGYITNNNVSVVQQGEHGSFRASGSWMENKGQYPNNTLDRYTYSIGGDMKLNKLTITSNFSYSKDHSNNIGYNGYKDYGYFYSMLIWSPADWDVRDYKDYWVVKDQVQNSSFTSTNNNPYFQAYERTKSLDKNLVNGTVFMSYDILPWMKLAIRSGLDAYDYQQDLPVSVGSFQTNVGQFWQGNKVGAYSTIRNNGYSFNNDAMLSGSKKLGKFTVDGLFGGTMYYKQDQGMTATTVGGISIPGFYSLKASVDPAKVTSNIYKQQVNSLYGRIALSWKDMLFLEGTGRNDWSSTLPASTRSYFYPSVAGSFIASQLLPKLDWLSMWKLRGSWTVSKTPADIYEINSVYNVINSAWGTLSSASLPTTVRGGDLRPETSETFEVGTNVNLYKNRASVDVAYYTKRMYDFITKAGVTPATGYSSQLVNLGEQITRRGVEVSARVTPVKNENWQWDLNLNWSKYARYYTKLDSLFSSKMPWVKVGNRADAVIAKDNVRDPQGDIVHNSAGLPMKSAYQSLVGYADPDWIWGVSSSLKYKNFTLNVSVDGRVGGLIYSATEGMMWYSGSHPNSVTPERALDVANVGTKNYIGKGVKVVSGTVTYDTYGNITSDTRVFAPNDVATTYEAYTKALYRNNVWGDISPLEYFDATFLKIRELSLTYDIPKRICAKFASKGASVSFVGQNMLLWAKQFKYSDPDSGKDDLSAPSQRYIGFNVKLNF